MKTLYAAAALFFGLAMQARAAAGPALVKVAGGQTVNLAQVADQAAAADVIFIGEAHDSAEQHRQQTEILRALHGRKLPLAVGIEMFATDGQKHLDDWVQGKIDEETFRKAYSSQWSYDWNLYRDLFLFARDNRIPLIALNVPKPIMSKVVRGGSAALSSADRKELPKGDAWTLNAMQQEYLRRIREQVFGNRPSPFPAKNFEEAQALRNAAFAWNIARFREKSPKTKVVAIAGIWHAIRSGAPEDLKKFGNPVSIVLLPQLSEIDPAKLKIEEADFVVLRQGTGQ